MLTVFLLLPVLNIMIMSFRPTVTGAPYGAGLTVGNYTPLLHAILLRARPVPRHVLDRRRSRRRAVRGRWAIRVAWQLARGETRLRALCYGIVLSPLLVGIVIRTYGWTILLGNNGLINRTLSRLGPDRWPLPLMYNRLGIIIALTHVFLPFMILPISAPSRASTRTLEIGGAVARRLARRRPFCRITLPLSMPGIQAGCILVFVLAISAYVTPP